MKSLNVLLLMAGLSTAIMASQQDRDEITQDFKSLIKENLPDLIDKAHAKISSKDSILESRGDMKRLFREAPVTMCLMEPVLKAASLIHCLGLDKKSDSHKLFHALIVKDAQNDALECVTQFDDYRQSILACYNDKDPVKLKILEELAMKTFEPDFYV